MKTLSIRNPWAYLVAFGVKDVENRSWKTKYRGPLLIHASGHSFDWPDTGDVPGDVYKELKLLENEAIDAHPVYLQNWWKLRMWCAGRLGINFYESDQKIFDKSITEGIASRGFPMPSKAIIGKVNLVDIVERHESLFAEVGCHHWVLEDAQYFNAPIICIGGKLRLWDYSDDLPALFRPKDNFQDMCDRLSKIRLSC